MPQTLDACVRLLKEGTATEQLTASQELRKLGPRALDALPHLLDRLPTAGKEFRTSLFETLVALGPRVIPTLVRRAQAAPESERAVLLDAERYVTERLGQLVERQALLSAWAKKAGGVVGLAFLRAFAGSQLYEKTQGLWDAVSAKLRNEDVSPLQLDSSVRDFTSALLSRMVRIGVVGIIVVLSPTCFLAGQTWLMSAQNEKLDRQNSLMATEQSVQLRRLFSPEPDNGLGLTSLSVPQWAHKQRLSGLMAAELGAVQPEIVAPLLRSLIRDPDPRISYAALVTAKELLNHEREEVRETFAAKLHPDLPALIERSRIARGKERDATIHALTELGVDAVPAVLGFLREMDITVAFTVASLLSDNWKNAPGAMVFVLEEFAEVNVALEVPSNNVDHVKTWLSRSWVLSHNLSSFAPSLLRHEAFHPYLRATMQDAEAWRYAQVIYQLLAHGGAAAEPLVPDVLRHLGAPTRNPMVRAEMIRVLAASDAPSTEMLNILVGELGSPSSLVWYAARESLVRIKLTSDQEAFLRARVAYVEDAQHRAQLLEALDARAARKPPTAESAP